jgi:two-component system, NtrC family, response regulator AtoC
MERAKANALVVTTSSSSSLLGTLKSCGLEVATAPDASAAISQLDARPFQLLLVTLEPGYPSLATLATLQAAELGTPLVAVGPDDEKALRTALAAGADEYLVWPCPATTARGVLDAALLRSRATVFGSSQQPIDSGLLGSSAQLRAARETLARVARGSATVLVRGETGTGKELAARAIHAQSPRAQAPFVKVHTPAVPEALLESELFGYERGAFTGANSRKPGRVELAEGGTLFLDEIGEISPTMQAKLLRLIQDREYERLGGTRPLRADIRVVAATHRDLEHMVDTGTFREDLFYRLNVVTVWLPPLRARREDIQVIAEHYLSRFCKENGKHVELDPEARRELQAERWSGNVRELVNVLERLVILAPGPRIGSADVRRELSERQTFVTQAFPEPPPPAEHLEPRAAPPPVDATAPMPSALQSGNEVTFSSAVRPLREEVRRTELRAITKALHVAKGNRALAARLLGVSRRTLYTKLEELGIS